MNPRGKGGEKTMKKEWKKPDLEVLDFRMTMSNGKGHNNGNNNGNNGNGNAPGHGYDTMIRIILRETEMDMDTGRASMALKSFLLKF